MSTYDDDDNVNSDHGAERETSLELFQCPSCLRRMRQEVFLKHPNTCRENLAKKRSVNVFDMTQYRAIRAGDKVVPVRKFSPNDSNKNKHTTRPSQTRSAKRDRRSDTVIQPVINNFCCPHCKRTFCEKAYDRHVSFCTSKLKHIQQPPSDQVLNARLKLDRRIKFGSNRLSSTLPSNTSPVSGSARQNISTTTINNNKLNEETKQPAIPPSISKLNETPFCIIPMRKKTSDTLARCPWCSKTVHAQLFALLS